MFDTQALQQHFPALQDTALLQAIAQHGQQVGLAQGQVICDMGQTCSHLALVLSGSARVYQLAASGREITLYRVSTGECCILTASCIMSEESFPAIAVCEQDLQAVVVPAALVEPWMCEFPAWRRFVWTLLAGRLSGVLCLLEEVTFQRMDQRLMQFLLGAVEQQGLQLTLTHQAIADDLGTSREVVSRILKDLEQRGLLGLARGQIHIHKQDALAQQLALCD